MPVGSPKNHGRRGPLLALLSANAVSMTGNAMAGVAIPWFVLQTTESAMKTGLVFGVTGAANVLAAFLGGPVVDRFGFKRCSILTDVVSGVAVGVVPLLFVTVGLSFWQLLLLVFLGALVDTPGATARQSMLPDLADAAAIPKERANSAFQAVRQLSDFLGPAAAGGLMIATGAIGVLWLNASTFAVSVVVVALAIPATRAASESQQKIRSRGYVRELTEGLVFVREDRLLLSLAAAAVAFNFLAQPLFTVVVVVYAENVFGNPLALGLLLGSFAGGMLTSSALFGAFGHRLPRRITFSAALITQSLPIWVLALEPSLVVSMVALALVGLSFGPVGPIIATVVQERTPRELLGRVNGALLALSIGAAPLGAVIVGWLLEVTGLRLIIGAIAGGLLAVSLALVLNPALRHMRREGTDDPTL